jgi:hypothetical protein
MAGWNKQGRNLVQAIMLGLRSDPVFRLDQQRTG